MKNIPQEKKKLKLETKKRKPLGPWMRKHLLVINRRKGIDISPIPQTRRSISIFFSFLIYFNTFFPLKLMIRYIDILRILCSSIYYIGGGLRLWAVVSLIKMDTLYGYAKMRSYENKQNQRSSSSNNTSPFAPSQHHPNVLLLDNIHKKIWNNQDHK